MKLNIVAVDPDTHGLAICYIQYDIPTKKLVKLKVDVLKIGRSLVRKEAALAMCRHPNLAKALERQSPANNLLVVEGQEVAYTGKTNKANPRDLMNLSLVAGAVTAIADTDLVLCPSPHEWKGSVPKHVHQCRVLTKAGIKYAMRGGKKIESQYPVPLQPERFQLSKSINLGDWKDINDAIGLGLWGIQQYWSLI